MHSPVGWLCFGIVVLCVINVQGNYQIIHEQGIGYPGQIFQSFVPAVGYRRIQPQVVARRVELRRYEDDLEDLENTDNEDSQSEENGEAEDEPDPVIVPEHAGSNPSPASYNPWNDEDEDDDEEDDEEEEEDWVGPIDDPVAEIIDELEESEVEIGDEDFLRSRQAYVNNKFHPDVNVQTVGRKTPNKTKAPSKSKKGSKPKGKPKKSNKKPNNSKKKKPSSTAKPVKTSAINALQKNETQIHEINYHTQKHQSSVIGATQFIATPVADLILRLSISLAKPVGHGNETSTYFNVPIRLPETIVKGIAENSSAGNKPVKESGGELQKPDPVIVVTTSKPIKVTPQPIKTEPLQNEEINDAEDDDHKEAVQTLPLIQNTRN